MSRGGKHHVGAGEFHAAFFLGVLNRLLRSVMFNFAIAAVGFAFGAAAAILVVHAHQAKVNRNFLVQDIASMIRQRRALDDRIDRAVDVLIMKDIYSEKGAILLWKRPEDVKSK